MTLHYIKIAWRNLFKYRVQNLITIFCLAVGIVCFSIVSFFLEKASSSPLEKLSHYDQMAWVTLLDEKGSFQEMTREQTEQIKNHPLPGVDLVSFYTIGFGGEITFIDRQNNEIYFQGRSYEIDENYLLYNDYLSIYTSRHPSLPVNGVILTESYARKIFGKTNPIGCKLKLPGYETEYYIINDVVNDVSMVNGKSDVQLFINYNDTHSQSSFSCRILIAKGKTAKELEDVLNKTPIYTKEGTPLHFHIKRLAENKPMPKHVFVKTLTLFIGALVLIAGVINFLKFVIQSFYNRMRELGLRKCLGSSHRSLFLLLFYEMSLVLGAACICSVAISEWFIPYMQSLISQRYIVDFHIDMSELIVIQLNISIAVLLICCFIAGMAVLRIRHTHIRENIVGIAGGGKHRLRNIMLGIQLIICMYFVGASLGIVGVLNAVEDEIYRPLSNDDYKGRLELRLNSTYLSKNWDAIRLQIEKLPEIMSTTNISSKGTIAPGKYSEAVKHINAICRQYVPEFVEIPLDTMYNTLAEPYGMWDMSRKVAFILSGISLLITILGIYAAISLDTRRRQKEVAIRKINGAVPRDIVILFGKLYVYLLIISFITSIPFICLTMSLFERQLTGYYLVWLIIKVFLIVSSFVLITVGYKSYSIMKLNPAEVIKNE